jgi:hypothetical protein
VKAKNEALMEALKGTTVKNNKLMKWTAKIVTYRKERQG